MSAEDIVKRLRELRPIIADRYKAREIGLFGSFVRGEQNANSDIDVLADFDDGAELNIVYPLVYVHNQIFFIHTLSFIYGIYSVIRTISDKPRSLSI